MVAATVFHSKTNTAPDDPTYAVLPSDWNSRHLVTMALQGADFANSNGVTFGVNTAGVVTASVAAAGANATAISGFAAAGGTITSGTVSAANSNGVTWGIAGQTLTASVQTNYQSTGAYLTTAALSQDSSKYAGTSTGMTGGSVTLNTSGIAINLPAYLTTAALSGDTTKYAGINGAITGGSITMNTSGVSINLPAYLTTAALSGDSSKYAGTATTMAAGLSATLNTLGLNLSIGAYLTTAALSQDSSKYAGTSTGMTGGSVTLNTSGIAISLPAYLTTADLSQNSSRYAGTGTSATNANITMNTNGLAINVPFATISSYENTVVINTSFDPTAQSFCVPFNLPQAGSFSFIRVIASFTNISTTAATTGQAANVSGAIYNTWNAVVYSLGTGASSQSLTAVQSGSLGVTDMNSMSVAANGTQYSVTISYAYGAAGLTTQNFTTQYSISNTNYSLSTNQIGTVYSGNRVFDIPFAASLSPGPYWLIFGGSTSSATNSTFYTFMTQRNGSFISMYGGNTVSLVSVKGFNNANATSVLHGAAVFSTVGGGTTANLPISALSTTASNPKLYFQMLRSA